VNQKIEGFFDCCSKKGLTGKQGVMIPETNVKDLMLRKDVVDAVKKHKFHIYSVRTVDEGIEILTGKEAGKVKADGSYPGGTINCLVNERLKNLAEEMNKFGKNNNNNKAGKSRSKKKS
jgi:predicted ATP-dependent protease